ALPAQGLIKLKELFHMPALWKVGAQLLQLPILAGAQETLELIFSGSFAGALHQFKTVLRAEAVGLAGQSVASPAPFKGLGRQLPPALLLLASRFHGYQQVERQWTDLVKHFSAIVLFVGQHQGWLRTVGFQAQDLLGQAE